MENILIQKRNHLNLEAEKSPLKKVGSFLKEARQARNLSVAEISESLRIGQEQVIALENGEEDYLPEKVFVKAMIRRISEKLNLDTKFILEELQGRTPIREESLPLISDSRSTSKKSDFFPLMIVISISLGFTASSFAINFIKNSAPSVQPNSIESIES